MRNFQEQVKKAFCYQKLFWPFTVWINCSSDLKNFANSRPSALNFKGFSRSLEQFFLTVGQNNFGNKIPVFAISTSEILWSYCVEGGGCVGNTHWRLLSLNPLGQYACAYVHICSIYYDVVDCANYIKRYVFPSWIHLLIIRMVA